MKVEGKSAGGFAERDARGSEYPKYEPIWDYDTPEEYLAAKAAEEADEAGGSEPDAPLEPLVEGIRLTAGDGTQVIAVTRFERDEGSRAPGVRAKRAWYWIKEKFFWLIGVVAASAAATAVWQSIS